jgi:carbonic anhydrase
MSTYIKNQLLSLHGACFLFLIVSCKQKPKPQTESPAILAQMDPARIDESSDSKCEYGTGSQNWNYQNQDEWASTCTGSSCNGDRQSPILIITDDTTKTKKNDKMMVDIKWKICNAEMLLKKYTLQADHIKRDTFNSLIWYPGDGSGKYQSYYLKEFHVHTPCEHITKTKNSRDSLKTPLEIHFVHENINNPKDILVVGVRYFGDERVAGNADSTLSVFANADNGAKLVNFPAVNLLPSMVNQGFWNYPGSLTTPGCDQKVTWIVMQNEVRVKMSTIDKIRSRYAFDVPDSHNARKIQVNNNLVWYKPVR